jgi:hypothetical protein
VGNKPVEELLKGTSGKNPGLFNNACLYYNHIHFRQWMKKRGGGDKLPVKLEKPITASSASTALNCYNPKPAKSLINKRSVFPSRGSQNRGNRKTPNRVIISLSR